MAEVKMKIYTKNVERTCREIEKDLTDYEFLSEFSLMNGVPRKMDYTISREGYKWLQTNVHTLEPILERVISNRWGERWGKIDVHMHVDKNDRHRHILYVEWEKVEL